MIKFKGLSDDLKVSDEVREIGLDAFTKRACVGRRMIYSRDYAFKLTGLAEVSDTNFWVLVKEAAIAKDLRELGFNAPIVCGLNYDGEFGRHFLAMKRIVPYSLWHIPKGQRDIAEKNFDETVDKLKKLRYLPDDCNSSSNCAYTPNGLQPIFFDFEEWGYPERVWNKIQSCFERQLYMTC
jgi:hypothetical protein